MMKIKQQKENISFLEQWKHIDIKKITLRGNLQAMIRICNAVYLSYPSLVNYDFRTFNQVIKQQLDRQTKYLYPKAALLFRKGSSQEFITFSLLHKAKTASMTITRHLKLGHHFDYCVTLENTANGKNRALESVLDLLGDHYELFIEIQAPDHKRGIQTINNTYERCHTIICKEVIK